MLVACMHFGKIVINRKATALHNTDFTKFMGAKAQHVTSIIWEREKVTQVPPVKG